MNIPELSTPLAALVAGMITSVHCLGMCGPLACSFCIKGDGSVKNAAQLVSIGAYHGGRVVSYTVAGLLAGALGASISWLFTGALGQFLPWAMIIMFLVLGFGLERKLHPPRWLARLFPNQAATSAAQANGKPWPALALGLATVLLPCGPLYMVLAVATVSGSSLAGAEFMAAFACGTIPLILLMQSTVYFAGGWLSQDLLRGLQRGIAFACAALILWRLVGGAEFHPDDPAANSCH